MKKVTVKRLLTTFVAATSLTSVMAWAGGVVVVHPDNANTLSQKDVSRIFLGKKKSFPDGGSAIPVDQQAGSPVRSEFVSKILNKNDQQVQAYWAQQLFTGKGTPPKEVDSSSEVKKLVAENPAVIGYIDSGDVDGSVKVVFEY